MVRPFEFIYICPTTISSYIFSLLFFNFHISKLPPLPEGISITSYTDDLHDTDGRQWHPWYVFKSGRLLTLTFPLLHWKEAKPLPCWIHSYHIYLLDERRNTDYTSIFLSMKLKFWQWKQNFWVLSLAVPCGTPLKRSPHSSG